MTEITGKKIKRQPRHIVDPVAFFLALICAPLLVTLLTFWLYFVPVFALMLGGPIYLVVATPVLLWWLGRHGPRTSEIAILAFCANLAACAVIFLIEWAAFDGREFFMTISCLIFGSVFAPAWAAAFASLYRRWRRPFFTQTL